MESSLPVSRKEKLKPLIVGIVACLTLTMNKYAADAEFIASALSTLRFTDTSKSFLHWIYSDQLNGLCYWSGVISFFYLIFPVFIIKVIFKEKVNEYGLKRKNALPDLKIYLLMLLIMIPLVLFFANTSSFQSKYPFYDISPGEGLSTSFWIWEAFYLLQFFSLEFFFRGFMVHGTKARFGFYSVIFMTIPYCMIHFGKPFPETIAAIVAGIILGMLSLKSRSVLPGVMIHYAVAITMDISALYVKGLIG